MPSPFFAMKSTCLLVVSLMITVVVTTVVMLSAKPSVTARAEGTTESIRTKMELIATIPPTADIYGPAELAWCTTLFLPGPELFVTLHDYGFAHGNFGSGGGSHFAIHRREPAGYRTIFRHATEGTYAINSTPLVCDFRPGGDGFPRRLFYVEDHSTGTDGDHQPHLWVMTEEGRIQDIEWVYPRLSLAKDEDAFPPDIMFRDDDLAFRYRICRILDQATRSAGEHVADVVGSYRLIANPPVDPPKTVRPFRLEVQAIRRVPLATQGD